LIPNIQKFKMDDVGTRLQHLADLQDLWSFAVGIETAGQYQTEPSIERTKKLQGALELLEAHMMNDYSPTTYAQVINNLPRDAHAIKDDANSDATGTSTVETE
jgi:hypothetical protein